jgi:NDP-sugar pyrophosphorylase family protein
MKAMVLAAGLGTRLRPLTDDRPKALVEVGGRTMLEITLTRLQEFGVGEVIINVHHFADMVIKFLRSRNNFGMRIEVSREDDLLLDTGGGLEKAAPFFLEDASGRDEPFILHNVDIISTVDLRRMTQAHRENQALATLAVQDRDSSRYLLFDDALRLCGRQIGRDATADVVRPAARLQALAFCGIHIISPRLLPMITEQGVFSIIDVYLRLAAKREKVGAFRADGCYWRDLGKPQQILAAAEDFAKGSL